jgi:DNA-directed RNA polymerase specialized sigma24 family protein
MSIAHLTPTGVTGTFLERNDPRLGPLILAEQESEAETLIGEVVAQFAIPLARRIVRGYSQSRTLLGAHDVDDLVALVAMRLMLKLRAARESAEHAVQSVEKYVTRLTYNAIHDHFRRCFPEHTRLKSRLRYLLTHDAALTLRTTGDGRIVCGLAQWAADAAIVEPRELDMRTERDSAGALIAVFRRLGGPVELDELVTLMTHMWSIEERSFESVMPEIAGARQPGADQQLEQRETIAQLWREIHELRPLQRKALLLNLRDADTTHVLTLLIAGNMASFEDLAAALEMSGAELNAIWNDLPLDDQRIALLLGVTRQQVINLRQAARHRLARRLSR